MEDTEPERRVFRFPTRWMAAVLILPVFFGVNGIWSAVTVAELCTLFMTAAFFIRQRKIYHYM